MSKLLSPLIISTLSIACTASAAERLYWDTSDAPGLQGGNGTWSAEAKNWSASADGTGPCVGWRAGAIAVFGDAENQLVTADGAVEVSGIEAQALDVAGGGISFPKTGLEILTDGNVTLSSAVRGEGPVIKKGKGVLSLGGINSLPGGFTLTAGKLRYYCPEAFGTGALRAEGAVVLVPASANMELANPLSIAPSAKLTMEIESPDFVIQGPITGGGMLEKTGRGKLVFAGSFDSGVTLNGLSGEIEFRPAQPVKLNATIKGGLLRAFSGSLAEGTKLLINEAGALAASGACDGVQGWVASGWIAPESTGTLAWDGKEEIGGTIDLKSFAGKYPSMSLGACGKIVVTGRLELPGTVLRVGGGGGDVEIRTALTGPLQLIIGAPSSSGNVTLSAENSFTGGLRIDGGTLRMGNAKAIPSGEITMGNRFTGLYNCLLDLNNFDLSNAVKLEGAACVKNAGGKSSTFSGEVKAGPMRFRFAADSGSSLKATGVVQSSEILIVGSDKPAPDGMANLVELAPPTPNTAQRLQVERGTVLRAIDGVGLPTEARLLLIAGFFESRGEFSRPLVLHKGARDGQGGVSFIWDRYAGSGFSAHGGPLTVRFSNGVPLVWGTQADGTVKPDNSLLVLNAPTADSKLTLDVPLDLAGEEVDRKNIPTPLHRISVQAAEAVLAQPVTSSGTNPAGILKLGGGTLTLNASNSYTDQTVIREGAVAFGSPEAMAGSGRTVSPESGTVVAANFPIDNAFLQRLASPSAMAFTVALGADSSSPLDFNSDAGAVLRGASLGATTNATYSGLLTPCDNVLRLGGGGGTLAVTNPANIPTVVGGTLTTGRVVLPEGTALPKDFVLLDGSLTIGTKAYESPKFSRTLTPSPIPAEPPTVTASASDRWVDAVWTFPINPEGGFAVEWSTDGKTFESAGTAWPEERRFPIFLKNPPKTWLGAPGEVFVRVAALDGGGKAAAWSEVAKTTCADRFDPELEIPAKFAGSADQRKYNANDPERLVTYTAEEKAAQSQRGTELAAQLKTLSNTTGQEFTIAPGIYRVKTGQLAIQSAKNLTIRANGVEIIVDDEKSGGVFSFNDCSDIVVTGRAAVQKPKEPGVLEKLTSLFSTKPPQAVAEANPLIIDSEQLAYSLARIIGVNTANQTLDIEILPGYTMELPEKERMLAYRPDGSLASIFQMGWEKLQPLTGRMYRFSTPNLHDPRPQNASLKPGNLLVMHNNEAHKSHTHALASTHNCANMTYESIRFVNGSGAPADHRTGGHTTYRDWRNSPRAGTNRLEICAGLGQFSKDGGTFLFEDCEFGPHLDDGINLLSGIGMAMRQTSATSLVMAGMEPTPGQTLSFYDFYTWEKLGEAKIVSSKSLKDDESVETAAAWCDQNRITSHALRGIWSVVLETPVRLTPFAPVVFSDHRCDNITVRRSLFRDQVAQIMLLQGARSGLIENNLLLRSTGPAVSLQFAQYWWEGPQPSNFIVRNNAILNNPISFPVSGEGGSGAISVWANTVRGGDSGRLPFSESEPVTERLFSGFRIEGNKILNPGSQGVLLRNTKNATIRHNKIVNPGTVDTGLPTAAITLYEASDVVVSDNEITIKNPAVEPVSILRGSDKSTIKVENNTVTK